jgi:thiol-disulfide isomerase/thioredoxin
MHKSTTKTLGAVPRALLLNTFLLSTFLLSTLLLSSCSKTDYQTTAGESGRFIDGKTWLLINYWAEWCKPCIEEMPELNHMQTLNTNRVRIFAVNYDGAHGTALLQQIAKLGIAVPVLLDDPAQKLGIKKPEALPTTFVFSPDGILRQTLQGPQTVASLTAAIEATTDNKP